MLPYLRVMAGGAVPSQPALVRFLSLVTDGAVPGSIAKGLTRPMTAVAGQIEMRALQWEVSVGVIELLPAQFHDVGVPALMFRMTRPALGCLDSLESAVEATVCGDVRGDALVTVET
jgi:hypothetical protein